MDNAAMESLMGIIKSEGVHARVYDSRERAEFDLFEYIECIYNRVRIHSALGYMSPAEFEKANWPKEEESRLQAERTRQRKRGIFTVSSRFSRISAPGACVVPHGPHDQGAPFRVVHELGTLMPILRQDLTSSSRTMRLPRRTPIRTPSCSSMIFSVFWSNMGEITAYPWTRLS